MDAPSAHRIDLPVAPSFMAGKGPSQASHTRQLPRPSSVLQTSNTQLGSSKTTLPTPECSELATGNTGADIWTSIQVGGQVWEEHGNARFFMSPCSTASLCFYRTSWVHRDIKHAASIQSSADLEAKRGREGGKGSRGEGIAYTMIWERGRMRRTKQFRSLAISRSGPLPSVCLLLDSLSHSCAVFTCTPPTPAILLLFKRTLPSPSYLNRPTLYCNLHWFAVIFYCVMLFIVVNLKIHIVQERQWYH